MEEWAEALDRGGLIIAHRGARSLAPENTLAAFAAASRTGAQACELDVGLSADGQLVVIHDGSLTRTSNAREMYPENSPWKVARFTLSEMQKLDFGSWFAEKDPFGRIAAGDVPRAQLRNYSGEPIPTLGQALDQCRNLGLLVNVEIKDLGKSHGGPDPALLTARTVLQMNMSSLVLISSFNLGYLSALAHKEPGLSLGLLVKGQHADPTGLMAECKAKSYHPPQDSISLEQIGALARRGVAILPWTVNLPDRGRSMMRAGVRGVFTDFPQRYKEHTKGRSLALR